MSDSRVQLGKEGEELAVVFLKKKGYRILGRNVSSKLGEIDIVAQHKGTICFIEVKTRRSDAFGKPKEALTEHKKHQLSKAALSYLQERRLFEKSSRFDVVSIDTSADTPRIELIENAFNLTQSYSY